ncbi:type VI secretion system baseplate subunit TssG [Ketobacter alkanivorans]|uniref:Type VI secretion protein n=1 Tax=Ketobacter alkanivorans TaxID=1917421 RepID=A0A2K9LPR9_9GAMM|nr:type VI secretion system baseplate subunit TssG [Ketobacter alkanivorans]AUM14349.1 hypothetical protein Kalk_18805 [Ketobacter alkanivorans]
METKNRLVPATINGELEQVREYSFFQLNALLRQFCEIYNQTNEQGLALRYRALASLGFPASDIESGGWLGEADKQFIELTVSFMGLYGPASPLPVYYTERVLQSSDPRHPSRDLMDLFNHRLISLLQNCWEKYRYYIQYGADGADHYSRWLLSLAGLDQALLTDQATLKWYRLLPFAGLLARGNGSADVITKVIANYFKIAVVEVEPWVPRVMAVPECQCNEMGKTNARLGDDLIMGDTIQDSSSKFLLHLRSLSPNQYRLFLPGTSGFRELVELVQYLIKGAQDYDICLHRSSSFDVNMDQSQSDMAELGWNLTLGDRANQDTNEPTRICVSDYHSI